MAQGDSIRARKLRNRVKQVGEEVKDQYEGDVERSRRDPSEAFQQIEEKDFGKARKDRKSATIKACVKLHQMGIVDPITLFNGLVGEGHLTKDNVAATFIYVDSAKLPEYKIGFLTYRAIECVTTKNGQVFLFKDEPIVPMETLEIDYDGVLRALEDLKYEKNIGNLAPEREAALTDSEEKPGYITTLENLLTQYGGNAKKLAELQNPELELHQPEELEMFRYVVLLH